ncbi:MAG: hypothetical protein AB7J28_14395 [Hyphomonadaceae bacterium]
MRRALFALLLCALVGAQAPPPAQANFAERRALLEADRLCRLFDSDIRSALEAGAWQARGALLRGGWTLARLGELETAAIQAARARRCGDPRTTEAANRAREAFAAWVRLPNMRFPGAERAWTARRVADSSGWLLVQDIPRAGAFGLQEMDRRSYVALILPLNQGRAPPGAAEIIVRDPLRARATLFDVPGRQARGLAAGAPSPAMARRILARNRAVETVNGRRRVVFAFPDSVMGEMAALDPREAAEIRIGETRFLIEIGDLAAARAFLSAQPR